MTLEKLVNSAVFNDEENVKQILIVYIKFLITFKVDSLMLYLICKL